MEQLGEKTNSSSTHRVLASVGKNRLDDGVQQTTLDEDGQQNGEMIDEQIRSSLGQARQNVQTFFRNVSDLKKARWIRMNRSGKLAQK